VLDKTPLPRHPYSKDNRPGLIAPDFDLEEVDLVFLEKSKRFLEQHVKSNPDRPTPALTAILSSRWITSSES